MGEGSDGGSDCGHGLVQRLRRLWRFVLHHQRTYQNDYHHDVLCAMVQHASSGWILGVGRDGGKVVDTSPVQPLRKQWGLVLHHEHTYHTDSHHDVVCAVVQHAGSGQNIGRG